MLSILLLTQLACDSDNSKLLPDATAGSLFGFSFSEKKTFTLDIRVLTMCDE